MGHSSNINLFTYIGNYSYKQARKREELVELTISFKEKKKIQVSWLIIKNDEISSNKDKYEFKQALYC